METPSLDRPEHLDDDSWRAVDEARGRVHFAFQMGDLPEVVGKSKELVETVARVVILSVEGTVNEKLDFQSTVVAAHKALERQPGVGLVVWPPEVGPGRVRVLMPTLVGGKALDHGWTETAFAGAGGPQTAGSRSAPGRR